jgi:hypothetical protein
MEGIGHAIITALVLFGAGNGQQFKDKLNAATALAAFLRGTSHLPALSECEYDKGYQKN